MALLLKNNWSFIHIPRCGGNSVRAALINSSLVEKEITLPDSDKPRWPFSEYYSGVHGHETADECGLDPDKCFTFIRPPLDWYVSNWNFTVNKRGSLENHGKTNYTDAITFVERLFCNSFDEWLNKCLTTYRFGPVSEMYKIYTRGLSIIRPITSINTTLKELFDIDCHYHINRSFPFRENPVEISKSTMNLFDVVESEAINLWRLACQ